MTMDDLKVLVEVAVKAALEAKGDGGGKDRGNRLDERHFRRVDKYGGGPGWKDFAFQFRTAVGAASSKIRAILDDIIKSGKDPDWDAIFVEWKTEEMDTAGQELYAVLSSVVTGEAMMVVRGVPSGNGWEAWSRLFNRFDPRTPAKALMAMMSVMQPKKVKDVRELPSAVEDWEVRIKNLKVEHDIGLDDNIKIALMTSFLPTDLQDHVFQWTDGKMKFPEIKDRVLSLAVNRASLSKPTPMEVDRVRADEYQTECTDYWGQDWEEEEPGEVEIDYVGETCRRCGGLGHYARECPTPKGKGKDASKGGGKAKGKGKGFGNQYGKGFDYGGKGGGKGQSKGKGKSFGGECWTCGEKGHRSSECDHGRKADMEIGSVEQEVGVRGVWAIAQVKAEERWQEVQPRRAGKRVGFDSRINCVECKPVIEEKNICKVEGKKPWRPIGSGEITVDSAAD